MYVVLMFISFMSFTQFKVLEALVTMSASVSQFIRVTFLVLFDIMLEGVFVGAPLFRALDWWAYVIYHMCCKFGLPVIFFVTSYHWTLEHGFCWMLYFVYFQLTLKGELLITVLTYDLFFQVRVRVFMKWSFCSKWFVAYITLAVHMGCMMMLFKSSLSSKGLWHTIQHTFWTGVVVTGVFLSLCLVIISLPLGDLDVSVELDSVYGSILCLRLLEFLGAWVDFDPDDDFGFDFLSDSVFRISLVKSGNLGAFTGRISLLSISTSITLSTVLSMLRLTLAPSKSSPVTASLL